MQNSNKPSEQNAIVKLTLTLDEFISKYVGNSIASTKQLNLRDKKFLSFTNTKTS